MLEKVIHLITPGIDSICSYFYIIENKPRIDLKLIHVPIASYKDQEIRCLQNLSKHLKHQVKFLDADLYTIKEEKDGFIPSRNLLLATLIDSSRQIDHKESNYISFSFTSDDRVYDSTSEFCENVSKVLSGKTRIGSEVRHMSKGELLNWFLNKSLSNTNDMKKEIILNTFSCYTPVGDRYSPVECLNCNACFRKSVVLHSAGLATRSIGETFLRTRLNILKETIPQERKDNIVNYVRSLVEQSLISKDFELLIGETK